MTARILLLGILVTALFAGAALYYLQSYAYYVEITAEVAEVQMTSVISGLPEPILFENIKAIDSDSSPIRYRERSLEWRGKAAPSGQAHQGPEQRL